MRIISVLLCISLVVCAADDYFVFAREWPGTICLNRTCSYMQHFNESTMNIHGLWFQHGPTGSCQYPSNCLNSTYDQTSLSATTRAGLSSEWVGVYSNSSSFHNHEWTKHGTCYEKYYSSAFRRMLRLESDPYQEKFFAQSLSLNGNFNVISKLASHGIRPSSTTTYSVDTLYQSIGTSRSNSLLTCKNFNNKYFLISFYLCINKSWQIINCPCTLTGDSGEVPCPTSVQIYIPPLNKAEQTI